MSKLPSDTELHFIRVLVEADEIDGELLDRMQAVYEDTVVRLQEIKTNPDEAVEERLWAAEYAGRLSSLMDAVRMMVRQ